MKCMQKSCQTRFNHATALDDDVRSYSIQLAATRIETVLCDCTKLSYYLAILNHEPKSKQTDIPMTRSNLGKTAQSLATFLATSFRKLSVVTAGADNSNK